MSYASEKIREIRIKKRYSQSELSKMAGLGEGSINSVEGSGAKVGVRLAVKVSRPLGISPITILKESIKDIEEELKTEVRVENA